MILIQPIQIGVAALSGVGWMDIQSSSMMTMQSVKVFAIISRVTSKNFRIVNRIENCVVAEADTREEIQADWQELIRLATNISTVSEPSTVQHNFAAAFQGSNTSLSKEAKRLSLKDRPKPADYFEGELDLHFIDMASKTHHHVVTETESGTTSTNKAGFFSSIFGGSPKYYIEAFLSGTQIAVTRKVENKCWNDEFTVRIKGFFSDELSFDLYEEGIVSDAERIGTMSFPILYLIQSRQVIGEHPLLGSEGDVVGHLRLAIIYNPNRRTSKDKKTDAYKVWTSNFLMRRNCKITLYQDAHIGDDAPPPIYKSPDEPNALDRKHADCWEDIFDSMVAAKKFIYIIGWSVKTNIHLVRRSPHKHMSLGDLLISKANEGVNVLIHIWNDKSSIAGINQGIMNTFHEETKQFFKNSKVVTSMSYRKSDSFFRSAVNKSDSVIRSFSTEYFWSHHQKSVIMDAPLPESDAAVHLGKNKRKVVAFLGGLDVTCGRWDTPHHSLFKSLNTDHKNDFYQNLLPFVTQEYGPRQPWHDIHCKVEGRIAHDILTNFVQRWKKNDVLHHLDDDDLLKPYQEQITNFDAPESWNVQMFRSIDKFSSPHIEKIERDIQYAYLNAIGAAERFIYIENQYFIGGSSKWHRNNDVALTNDIPLAIIKKIQQKIQEGKHFTVYIVIPMYPEGDPAAEVTQQILYWQWNTMSMMFYEVHKAMLESAKYAEGLTVHDYLNFYCLGKRETQSTSTTIPPLDSREYHFSQVRRSQIYVHAKLMVVDDEYIIVGSANINERSMAGDRDTEICIGGWQPQHISEKPRGEVHRFRMSLWSEHLNASLAEFLEPNTISCVRKINDMATENWMQYTSPRANDSKGFLMTYPAVVSMAGHIHADPISFPDTTASVSGALSKVIPNALTL